MSELINLINRLHEHPNGSTVEVSVEEMELIQSLKPLFSKGEGDWGVNVTLATYAKSTSEVAEENK